MEQQRSREEYRPIATSPSIPQPDSSSPIIQELLEWVPKHYINGVNGPSATPNRPFMPLPELETFLGVENRIIKILGALYPEREPPFLVELLKKSYIRVFIILNLIGKGRYIETFVQHPNLRDSHLPFLERPAHFPTEPNDPTFWKSFYEEQFAFCAHVFRYNESRMTLEDLCILPIISKEVLGQGGSAAIYKVKIHPHYDRLDPAPRASTHSHPLRPGNTYVLKTYNTKDASTYYDNEVDAFTKLASKDGTDRSLIQFLGSYRQGDTYNILLEYADRGTLEDYFQNVGPPTLGEDIVTFWERLFKVIQALSRIHKTERRDSFHGPDILIGWHQDVKPNNILVLSGKSDDPYDVQFKLADLGLSHFKRTVTMDRRITDRDVGGTKDYGAPECHRSDEFLEQIRLDVKPFVDLWSLGGVCSEAAVWVVLGKDGLKHYRARRRQEICSKNTSQDGSCFHDGESVLRSVDDMHDRLLDKGEIRPGDHVTRAILQNMVSIMLQADPEDRFHAVWHWNQSQKILKKARLELERSNLQTSPALGEPVADMTYASNRNLPRTPPPVPHGAVQKHEIAPHMHGPPPHCLQYSTDLQIPRRSDTWHQSDIRPDLAGGVVHGSPSPPSPTRQALRASPPLGRYTSTRGQTQGLDANFDKVPIGHGETPWQNDNNIGYTPPTSPAGPTSPVTPSVSPRGFPDMQPRGSPSSAGAYSGPPTNLDASTFPLNSSGSNSVEASLELRSQPLATAQELNKYAATSPMKDHPSRSGSIPSNTALPPSMAIMIAAEPLSLQSKPEKPFLSYEDARGIREAHQSLSPVHRPYLNDLNKRDHVFLIDDSRTMGTHWGDVISFFKVFAYFAKRYDDNGLEMYFTVSTKKETFRDTTPAVSLLRSMTPTSVPNFDNRLDEILRGYQSRLERESERSGRRWSWSSSVKPLSLYVLSNGDWPGCDAIAPVESMIEKLRELKLTKARVGIQFIRFGRNPDGIKKLGYLDTGLRKKYGKQWDIVDTEPFPDGNLLKMYLGAISNWFDDDDDEQPD